VAFVDGAYLSIFRDERWPVSAEYMQRIDTDGTALGTSPLQNAPLFVSNSVPSNQQVATDGSTAFVIWLLDNALVGIVVTP
jgi:hypothetical protein